ncbi:unnamed protein product [Lymnaea stagnalis]|uniref:Uncharacterized protein n=1 Tax=Lymnaea stagnalis TaxID=6523 RepID=A0AAV2H605_LYMST
MAEDLMSSVKIIARAQGIYDNKGQGDGQEAAPNTGCTEFERGPRGTSTTSRVDRGNADRPAEGAAKIQVEGKHGGAARVNMAGRAKANAENGHEDDAEVNLEGGDEDTVKVNIEETSAFVGVQCLPGSKFRA